MELTQRVFWITAVFVGVVLVGSIFKRGLARSYPALLLYLIVQIVASDLLLQVPYLSPAYTEGWRWYSIVMAALRLAVAGEVFGHITGHFIGVGKFRIWVGLAALALGSFLAWAGFTPLEDPISYPQTIALMVERWEALALAVTIGIVWLFFTRVFDSMTPIRANTATHWKMIAAYFLIDSLWSAAALIESPMWLWYAENIAALVGKTVCLTAWIALLTREGQKKPEVPALTQAEIEAVYRSEARSFEFVTKLPGQVEDR